MDDHSLAKLVAGSYLVEERLELGADVAQRLFRQKTPIEHRGATIDHTRRLCGIERLAADERIDVDRRVPRSLRNDRERRSSLSQRRAELRVEEREEACHSVNRAVAEEGHAPVRGRAENGDVEPVDAAVAETHAIGVERLGDDDVGLLAARENAALGEVANTGEAAALFVDRAALLDRAVEDDARAADRLDRIDRGDDPGLHVACSAPVHLAVADGGGEGIDRPTVTRRHDVEMSIVVETRPRRGAGEARNHIDARVTSGVIRVAFGGDVLGLVAESAAALAHRARGVLVMLARRVDRGNADELGERVDHLRHRFGHAREDELRPSRCRRDAHAASGSAS